METRLRSENRQRRAKSANREDEKVHVENRSRSFRHFRVCCAVVSLICKLCSETLCVTWRNPIRYSSSRHPQARTIMTHQPSLKQIMPTHHVCRPTPSHQTYRSLYSNGLQQNLHGIHSRLLKFKGCCKIYS